MIDQVFSHTSIEHAWFRESRQDRTNPKADWYVWADPREDGTPPNNWMSIFGGVAWQWEPRREQYFLHNFLADQPDLDFHNPAVQQATLDYVKFWLDRGVDGFRLDSINFCFHDKDLRDKPAKPLAKRLGRGCWTSTRARSASARSRPRTRWRPPPNTPRRAACTWATASSCW
jgi:alpha-glucosidase